MNRNALAILAALATLFALAEMASAQPIYPADSVEFADGLDLEADGCRVSTGNCGGGGGSTTGTPNLTWTVDDDNTGGSEPADGAGLVIEGGTGDASLTWNAGANALELATPSGADEVRIDGATLVTSPQSADIDCSDVTADNYTPANASCQGHLEGIDTALGSAGGGVQTLYFDRPWRYHTAGPAAVVASQCVTLSSTPGWQTNLSTVACANQHNTGIPIPDSCTLDDVEVQCHHNGSNATADYNVCPSWHPKNSATGTLVGDQCLTIGVGTTSPTTNTVNTTTFATNATATSAGGYLTFVYQSGDVISGTLQGGCTALVTCGP